VSGDLDVSPLPSFSILLVSFFLLTNHAKAQQVQPELTRGVVIEKLVSLKDPSKSYALYLPDSYTPQRAFPILYCFDPMARGAVPVTRFKDAAEKFNYIVVGSNNSRNGPNQPIADIVRDLWDDTHARLSIDEKRVYLAGFSGGARVATSVAFWLKDRVAGVIACGGGFPPNTAPSTPRSFVLFGTAGTEDFNNLEMQTLFRTLEGSSPAVRLSVFEGGHSWLPSDLAMEAFEWFEIHAIRNGAKPRDQAWLEQTFNANVAKARAADEAKNRYDAYLRYLAVSQDFQGLLDVANVQSKVTELKSTKEVRDGLKREKEMGEAQQRRVQSIHALIAASNSGAESLVELRDALRDVRQAAGASQPSVNRTVAKRVISSLLIEFFELGNNELAQKNYDRATNYFRICTEIQPDNPRGYFYLGRVYALNKDRSKAISALQTAAGKGFASPADLAVADFAELQSDKRFLEILDLVKQNQGKQRSP
jgi:poly(3-hydroxybutyrate) depolymerase